MIAGEAFCFYILSLQRDGINQSELQLALECRELCYKDKLNY